MFLQQESYNTNTNTKSDNQQQALSPTKFNLLTASQQFPNVLLKLFTSKAF